MILAKNWPKITKSSWHSPFKQHLRQQKYFNVYGKTYKRFLKIKQRLLESNGEKYSQFFVELENNHVCQMAYVKIFCVIFNHLKKLY